MIVNLFSVLILFIDAVSIVLMIWGGILSVRLFLLAGKGRDEDQRRSLEGRTYLLLLTACVILMIRLMDWPFLYLTFQSFVPEIKGAMCIFGVTQVRPMLTRALEIMKPLSFFLIGGWLLLHGLDRSTRRADLLRRKLLLLSIISALVVVESATEIWLIIRLSPSVLVSCCTTVIDLLNRPTRIIPSSILGEGYGLYLEVGYWASNAMMVALMALLLWRGSLEGLRRRRLWLGLVAGVSLLVNASVFVLAMLEVLGPRLMRLPFHHCLYCLWQYVPSSTLIFTLFVIGTFSPIWAFLLDMVGRKGEATVILPQLLRRLYIVGIASLGGSAILLGIHLLLLRTQR